MPVARHPSIWWKWYVPEGENKEIGQIFTDGK